MTKRSIFTTLAALCVALTFFSCEQLSEQSALPFFLQRASVSLRFGNVASRSIRAAADDTADTEFPKLVVAISGGVNQTQEARNFDLSYAHQNGVTFNFINLPAGAAVTITAEYYNYDAMLEQRGSATTILQAGQNNIALDMKLVEPDPEPQKTGNLTITVNGANNGFNSFDVTLTDTSTNTPHNGKDFNQQDNSNTVTLSNIPIGTYSVAVKALRGSDTYSGSLRDVTISEGQTTACEVTVTQDPQPTQPETYTITIDGTPASLADIRALSDGTPHTVAVTGTLDNAALSAIASAIKAISSGTTVSLNLSATTGLTSIGQYAFSGCTSLTSITIPASVTSIGYAAFDSCTSLTSMDIPNSVTSIGSVAFGGCTALTGIEIPASVTSIGDLAFSGCTSLETIRVAEGNKKYDSKGGCNAIIETATNTLVAGCKGTVIPATVTSIGDSAFNGCTALTGIEIPASVKSIGRDAFSDCTALASVTIGSGVTSIGYFVFNGCDALAEVTFGTTSGWKSNGTDADVSTPAANATNLKNGGIWRYGLTRNP